MIQNVFVSGMMRKREGKRSSASQDVKWEAVALQEKGGRCIKLIHTKCKCIRPLTPNVPHQPNRGIRTPHLGRAAIQFHRSIHSLKTCRPLPGLTNCYPTQTRHQYVQGWIHESLGTQRALLIFAVLPRTKLRECLRSLPTAFPGGLRTWPR